MMAFGCTLHSPCVLDLTKQIATAKQKIVDKIDTLGYRHGDVAHISLCYDFSAVRDARACHTNVRMWVISVGEMVIVFKCG